MHLLVCPVRIIEELYNLLYQLIILERTEKTRSGCVLYHSSEFKNSMQSFSKGIYRQKLCGRNKRRRKDNIKLDDKVLGRKMNTRCNWLKIVLK